MSRLCLCLFVCLQPMPQYSMPLAIDLMQEFVTGKDIYGHIVQVGSHGHFSMTGRCIGGIKSCFTPPKRWGGGHNTGS